MWSRFVRLLHNHTREAAKRGAAQEYAQDVGAAAFSRDRREEARESVGSFLCDLAETYEG
jgi:hypothetical protein